MKLLTTALALDTLGPDYRFRTTIETNGALSADGKLSGDLILVGRGDPNLSNRKFPFDLKEEFDGPPEKALAELADRVAARGVKEISGDVVGDDSYFSRERYPDGWEIDDMVWEYGAAISAIVVDDNTVTLTLTSGEKAGDAVQAVWSRRRRNSWSGMSDHNRRERKGGLAPDAGTRREHGGRERNATRPKFSAQAGAGYSGTARNTRRRSWPGCSRSVESKWMAKCARCTIPIRSKRRARCWRNICRSDSAMR